MMMKWIKHHFYDGWFGLALILIYFATTITVYTLLHLLFYGHV